MTPLIDVVFLLVIFFMVSSHLARQENQVQVNLPAASTAANQSAALVRRVVVHVQSDGTMILAGRPTTADQLTRALQHETASTDEKIEVRVRADRAAEYQTVSPVLLACAKAGVWDVRLAVREAR